MQKTQGGAFVIPDLFLSICVSQRRSDSDSVTLLHADRAQRGFTRGVRQASAGQMLDFVSVIQAPCLSRVGEKVALSLVPYPVPLVGLGAGLRRGPGVRTRAPPRRGLVKMRSCVRVSPPLVEA